MQIGHLVTAAAWWFAAYSSVDCNHTSLATSAHWFAPAATQRSNEFGQSHRVKTENMVPSPPRSGAMATVPLDAGSGLELEDTQVTLTSGKNGVGSEILD